MIEHRIIWEFLYQQAACFPWDVIRRIHYDVTVWIVNNKKIVQFRQIIASFVWKMEWTYLILLNQESLWYMVRILISYGKDENVF